jgi:hypothetical protein
VKEEVVVDFSVTWWTTFVCTDQCGLKFQASGLLFGRKEREASRMCQQPPFHFLLQYSDPMLST